MIMAPASEALAPHIAAVSATLGELIVQLNKEVAAGRLATKAADQRLLTERTRLYAPFQPKIDALRAAQKEAIAAYESHDGRCS